jgi:uncharacterized protein (TIGR03067 family)
LRWPASSAGGRQTGPAKFTLDGRWTGGEARQPDARCTLAVSGNHVEYRGLQPGDWLRGSFVLNEQAHPMQMDLSIQQAGDMNINDVGTTALLIYELNGDQLRVAVAGPERPTNFAVGQGVRVFSFKRDAKPCSGD